MIAFLNQRPGSRVCSHLSRSKHIKSNQIKDFLLCSPLSLRTNLSFFLSSYTYTWVGIKGLASRTWERPGCTCIKGSTTCTSLFTFIFFSKDLFLESCQKLHKKKMEVQLLRLIFNLEDGVFEFSTRGWKRPVFSFKCQDLPKLMLCNLQKERKGWKRGQKTSKKRLPAWESNPALTRNLPTEGWLLKWQGCVLPIY